MGFAAGPTGYQRLVGPFRCNTCGAPSDQAAECRACGAHTFVLVRQTGVPKARRRPAVTRRGVLVSITDAPSLRARRLRH